MSHRCHIPARTPLMRFKIALTTLWTLILLLGMLDLGLQSRRNSQAISTGSQANDFRTRGGNWYFRTEQWRADARTLLAAARWCFEPVPPYATNLSSASAAANTNRTVVAPS